MEELFDKYLLIFCFIRYLPIKLSANVIICDRISMIAVLRAVTVFTSHQ